MRIEIAAYLGNKLVGMALATFDDTYPVYTETLDGAQPFYVSPAQDPNLDNSKVRALAEAAEYEYKRLGFETFKTYI